MIGLTVERAGLADLGRVASGVREFTRLDYTEYFERYLEPDFEAIQQEQFDSEGARGEAGQWQPLSPAYAAWKAARFPGKPILQGTGRLRDSYVQRAHGEAYRRITPTSLERGSNVPHAGFHATGTSRMPARPPIGVRETDVQRWADQLGEWVVGDGLPRILGG